MLILGDIIHILKALAVVAILQTVFFHFFRFSFAGLIDRGWAITKIGPGLIVALAVWITAHLGAPVNTTGGIYLVTVLLFVVVGILFRNNQRERIFGNRHTGKIIIAEELLFFIGFAGMSLIRGFNPEILDLEKFMDFGFVQSYINSPTLPAEDMWFARSNINYYSFGHFWASVMIRLFGAETGIGFNLMLGYLCGLSLVLAFSIVTNLLICFRPKIRDKRIMIAGVLGAVLVTFSGNSHLLWWMIKNGVKTGYWYPDATRFIYHTIHEFPGYSFVVSDLHAHLLALPIVLTFLLVVIVWTKSYSWKIAALVGVLMGIMAMTNTWDVLIYGLLLGILGAGYILYDRSGFLKLIKSVLSAMVATIVVALPWYANFVPIPQGLAATTERSPLWQLAVLWTGHIIFTLTAWGIAASDRMVKFRSRWLIMAMAICGLVLLVIPEFFYVLDIYTTYPRANTMFKLTYQAFVIMSILGGWAIGMSLEKKKIWLTLPLLLLFAGMAFYSPVSFSSYYKNFRSYQGLDGLAWFKKELPAQYNIAQYLKNNPNGMNMVEAVGDSYTKYNAISAVSGRPTVVGWKVHEWLWRGGYDPVAKRAEDVSQIYQGTEIETVKKLLNNYQVGYIVVGANERTNYQVNEGLLKQLGPIVEGDNNTYLIKVGF